MNFKTKFSNGDKVWHIKQDMEYQWQECGFCGGFGEITGVNGEAAFCPKCVDKGGWNMPRMLAWGVEGPLTIGEIRVRVVGENRAGYPAHTEKLHCKGILPEDIVPTNFGPQEYKYEEEYNCKETGIGAGRVYNVENLFATEAEALEACRERNGKEELCQHEKS